MLQAAIDIGTNTFNLIIADKLTGKILYKEKQAVRLGKGGISRGVITGEATERAVNTLLHYKEKVTEHKVDHVIVTATSAVRNAGNQEAFLSKVLAETGFRIRVLSGDEEASFIYEGVRQYLKISDRKELIIDIGGGSIEFIIADKDKPLWMKSFEIGGQRLMDKFHEHDPISQGDIERLNAFLMKQLHEVFELCRQHEVRTIIGSAGSFDTLQDMFRHTVDEKDYGKYGHTLPISYFQTICKDLTTKNRAERMKIPGMIAMRVDMIVVAVLLIKLVIEQLGIEELKVSAFSLKEGILFGNNNKIGIEN